MNTQTPLKSALFSFAFTGVFPPHPAPRETAPRPVWPFGPRKG